MNVLVIFEGGPIDNQVREMPELLQYYHIVEEKKINAVPYDYTPVRTSFVRHIYNKSKREENGMYIFWYAGSRDEANNPL